MGLWRYSLAAMIVLAAMLDVLWWVPMYSGAAREREAIQATTPQCRALHLQRRLDHLQRELDQLERDLDATLAEIGRTRALQGLE